jgi:hypothetical protein
MVPISLLNSSPYKTIHKHRASFIDAVCQVAGVEKRLWVWISIVEYLGLDRKLWLETTSKVHGRKSCFFAFGFMNQDREKIPDCYINLYQAAMSLRNSSLSWNYWLQCVVWYKNKYTFELQTINETLASNFDCHFIVQSCDIYVIKSKQ